ncbi:precorrin-2 C(20)-methyltransferase [Heliophilum fasciatum]|nr:precorrin-2 C(20)-methyltransferase [Heliophilum fasciatum]
MFYGIGVGPGDPELITLRAAKILNSADIVIAPYSKEGRSSTALAIIESHLGAQTEVFASLFPMTYDEEALASAWAAAQDQIAAFLQQGKTVAFITLGDPMLFSTYIYVYKKIKQLGWPIETVPGIPSFCAAASRAGIPLAEGQEMITIVPATSECNDLDPIFEKADNLILMKVYREKDQIIDRLAKHNLIDNAALISRCGLEGEMIIRDLEEVKGKPVNYLSLIIAKKSPAI